MRSLAVIAHDGKKAAQPHDPDIRALLRVSNVHNVPLATNLATADLVMTALADERARAAAGWASPD